jgi:hypothetical protein
MDNLNDIKQIWMSADLNGLPGKGDAVKMIRRYRLKQTMKTAALILLVIFLFAVMIHVVFDYESQLLATRLGEACFFITMFILLGNFGKSLKRVLNKRDCSNDEFIAYLKAEQEALIAFQKRTQVIGFVIVATGLYLYLFEGVREDTLIMLSAYAILTLWLAFSWFVIRPRSMKRKMKKINETLNKLQKISIQLTED